MNLSQHRKAAGLTQAQLGKVIGRHKETVRQYEAATDMMPLYKLQDYAEACKITLGELLGYDGEAQAKLDKIKEIL